MRQSLRRYLLLLVTGFVVLPAALAQQAPLWESQVEWFYSHYSEIISTLEHDDGLEILPVVSAIGELWVTRDGSLGIDVAPAIAHALTHQPALTLSWFQHRPDEFDSWIEAMPHLLFTDYTGAETTRLESVRTQLVVAMNDFVESETDPSLASMAIQVAQVAEDSVITTID